MAGGRPSKYKSEFVDQARKLCLLGATTAELANFFEVTVSTVSKWLVEIPEFSESVKESKAVADAKVVRSLYQRATGYSCTEDKIAVEKGKTFIVETVKNYPPETTACIYWLNNRQSDEWRNTHHVNYTNRTVDKFSDNELEDIAAGGSKPSSQKTNGAKAIH